MKIGIVIPTYNEKSNIELLVNSLAEIISKNNLDATIIIVDDNSPDGTANIVKKLQKKHNIELILHQERSGLGKAYIAGFKKAIEMNCDFVFSMDADLSHNPKYIPDFLKKMNDGCDIVLGSRYVKGGSNNWGIARRIVSKGGNTIAKTILGIKVNDLTTGYRCYTAKALKKINPDSIKSDGYAFLEEILFLLSRKGLSICEIPIYFEDRTMGASKLRKIEIFKFLVTVFRLKAGSLLKKH